MALLEVEQLDVSFATDEGEVRAVQGLDFTLETGRTLALVGESGSGKSQVALALLGLIAANGRSGGRVRFEGTDLLRLRPREWNRLRGRRIGMVFQDPMTALNPYLRIGVQMQEVLQQHRGIGGAEARRECEALLDAVRLGGAAQRLRQYPHELSGGQRQRVMIAMALLCRPQLLIADEPTTALDTTVQAQLLALLAELRRELGLAMIFITHDLGLAAAISDDTLVLYGGRMMEYGPTAELLAWPRHPYTRGLLESRPRLDLPVQARLSAIPGQPPDPHLIAPGCPFQPRCAQRLPECAELPPPLRIQGGVQRRCHGLDG